MRGGSQYGGVLCAVALALAVAGGPAAQPRAQNLPDLQAPDQDRPAILQADQVIYDRDLGTVTARGDVEVSQGERILLTDSLTYNLETDVITAQGDVSLLEPTGEVVFADYVELTGDLKEGAITSFRMLLTDRSRLAAASAVRTSGRVTELHKVVFSPCEPCREDPDRAPLWQLKAEKVVHDQEAKTITYRDAQMEIFGVPVAYTPYFQHPDPTVERKSGFLAPSFGVSDQLGGRFQIPYYWSMSQSRDLTFEPIVTTKQGLVLSGEYRSHTGNGRYSIAGSATVADRGSGAQREDNVFRGHIDARGRFNIDPTWRWGFNAHRSSDDTYLRVYDFPSERFLTSRAFVEGLRGRNYMAAQAYTWQGIRQQDRSEELPIVFPEAIYSFVSEPGRAGGHYFMESSALGLTRQDGRDAGRLSTTLGWTLPYTDNLGGITELTTALHGDAYLTDGVDPDSDAVNPANPRDGDAAGRLFPQVALSYRYPLVRHSTLGREVIEPRVQLVAGPNGGNPGAIPNEDSRDFEFDDTNLFALNRFPGRDRISSGQRVDYGLSYSIYGDGGGYVSAFIGQSYRINSDSAIPEAAGGDDDFSDIVGSVQVSPVEYVDAVWRSRFDEDDLSARRNELDLYVGPPALNLNLNYVLLEGEDAPEPFGDREEIYGRVSSRFSRYWTAYAAHRRDIETSDSLSTEFGLIYHDECFLLDMTAQRTFYQDREIDPDTSFLVRVVFKHLGQVAAN